MVTFAYFLLCELLEIRTRAFSANSKANSGLLDGIEIIEASYTPVKTQVRTAYNCLLFLLLFVSQFA